MPSTLVRIAIERALSAWPPSVPLGGVRGRDGIPAACADTMLSPDQRQALQAAGWIMASAGWWELVGEARTRTGWVLPGGVMRIPQDLMEHLGLPQGGGVMLGAEADPRSIRVTPDEEWLSVYGSYL